MACGSGKKGLYLAILIYCFSRHIFIRHLPDSNNSYLPSTAISYGHEKLFVTFYSATGNVRSKFKAVPVTYGSKVQLDSFAAIMGLMLAGDVHPCPGPTVKRTASATN